jgi:hypothetical protein
MSATVATLALTLWGTCFDPQRPARVLELTGPRGFVAQPVFSPDGRWLAAMAGDEEVTRGAESHCRSPRGTTC